MANDAPTTSDARRGGMARLRREWALRPERNIQILIGIVAALLFVSPALAVIIGAFRTSPFTEGPQAGVWSLQPVIDVFTSPETWGTLWNTVLLTVASVIPATILAVFFATLVTRTNVLAKWLITGTMAILVALPPLFYALSWSMLGNETVGLINVWLRGISSGFAEGYLWGQGPLNIESWGGLILVSIFRATAFMFLILIGPFSTMDRSLEEAARVSGAGPIRTFFGTQIPVLMPAISAVVVISTVASMEAFDVPVVLGVPADIYVLPTEVYRYLNDARNPFYGHASAVSILLLVILVGLLVIERRLQGRRRFTTVTGKGARQGEWSLGRWRLPLFAFSLVYAVIAVLLPLLQLLLVSFSPYFGWNPTDWSMILDPQAGLTTKWFETILSSQQSVNTFLQTAAVAALAAVLGMVAVIVILWAVKLRRGRLGTLLDGSQMLPMVVPGLLLALGIITVVLIGPWKSLYGSSLLLMAALFIAVVPLASRTIAGAIVQIPAELEEATRVSGGSRARALFAVVFRLLLPSALNGWLLCFVVASGTLAIPMLLGERRAPMLAIKVYDDYLAGNFSLAAASFVLFVVEILLIAVVIEILKRLLTRRTKRRKLVLATSADADWTGAVRVRPTRHLPRKLDVEPTVDA
ncbi:iron ABC transporter permease [Microbacterium sp. zg.B48]|uniref:ABC transporter permease n=1 Tax=Microbacterium sp. zg.B48 TaxID=2969408 RepID=UPI00214BE916|nr:iron ABC transporter permease [Microbacterium sp. zg.B48]MCR2764480.1 iron ABC transporter permease [Microbacterium sp. zg.B48]